MRGGSALEIKTFLGPVKWHRAVRRVPFGAQKSRDEVNPLCPGGGGEGWGGVGSGKRDKVNSFTYSTEYRKQLQQNSVCETP